MGARSVTVPRRFGGGQARPVNGYYGNKALTRKASGAI